MRILIAPDKFKGSLDAFDVARSLRKGWLQARPKDQVRLLPMTDGGDGFGSILGQLLSARLRHRSTVNAAHQPCRARWWWSPTSRLAVIETAQSNGLALLPSGQFHPFDLDTTGVASLVLAAVRAGARHLLIGVGGSATNDGGFGLARGLGWRFTRSDGSDIVRWTDLLHLHRLHPPEVPAFPDSITLTVATDVDNPLLGPRGASRVYGPQKGLRPDDLALAESCLRRLAHAVRYQLGVSQSSPGAGAAGGLGFGLMAFAHATRQPGFEVFARHARLESHLRWADLILTGEGAFDRSSHMGKGVGELLRRTPPKPTLLIAGRITGNPHRLPGLMMASSLVDLFGETYAMHHPRQALQSACRDLAQRWSPHPNT
jgi:glycerate kinase